MATGFTTTASVCPTTHQAVLTEVVRKLRAEITEFATESTCFLSDVSAPGVEIQEDLFCTVAPQNGRFDLQPPIGSAEFGIDEVIQIGVTVWSRMQRDRLEHSAQSLTDGVRGLLVFKRRVLQALAGRQLYSDAPENSVPLLIEPLRPVQALHPLAGKSNDEFRSCSLVFQAAFTWDLLVP